ncbi:MAG: tetratricopeptide repeat protein [Tepidibacillus sp.]
MYDKKKVLIFLLIVTLIFFGGITTYMKGNIKTSTDTKPNTENQFKPSDTEKKTSDKEAEDGKVKTISIDSFYQLWSDNELDKANSMLGLLLEQNKNDATIKIIASDFYFYYTGGPEKSMELLDEVLQIDPNNDRALIDMAYYITEMKDRSLYPLAEDYAKRAIDNGKKKVEQLPIFYYDTYAWVLGLNGKYKEAFDLYVDTVFENYQFDDPSSMLHYALLLEDVGEIEMAKQVYTDIMNINPQNLPIESQADLPWAEQNAQIRLNQIQS